MVKPIDSTQAWDINAVFWDSKMGEGNAFHLKLVAPAVEKLLNVEPNQSILDACCGNGQFSRRLAQLGAKVTAFDGSSKMIEIACQKSSAAIEYQVVDATNQKAMEAFGRESFDKVVANMALMDLPEIRPLFKAIKYLLKKDGAFVFSITHPCFNRPGMGWFTEMIEHQGNLIHLKGVKITQYKTSHEVPMRAMVGQPVPHVTFDRPLHQYLQTAFGEGFVLDGIEEPTFSDSSSQTELGWQAFPEIPPVLVVRLRSF